MKSLHVQQFVDNTVLQSGDVPVGLTTITVRGGHLYMVGNLSEFEDGVGGTLALQFVPDDGLTGRCVEWNQGQGNRKSGVVRRVDVQPDSDDFLCLVQLDDGSFDTAFATSLSIVDSE